MKIPSPFSVALLASVLLLSPAFGQQEESKKPEAKPGDAAGGVTSLPGGEKPKEPVEADKPEAKSKDLMSATGHDGMVNRRIAGLLRLRADINEKFKLSEEKRKIIDRMFDDYMAALLGHDPGPHAIPNPEHVAAPQELPRLTKELKDAKESGDEKEIATIQAKIQSAKIVLEPSVIDPPSLFLNAITFEIDDEHQEDFKKLADRWRSLRVREIMPDTEFKRLLRSIRDTELDLSEAERAELLEMLSKSMRDVPPSARIDPAKASEKRTAMLPKVLEKLNPAQREHLEKTIAMLDKWSTEDEEAVAAVRARLGGHSPNNVPPASRLQKVDPPPTP